MAIRVRGRRRSLSKKVSSFNMYDDQVYQIRAIMESNGEYKDAPVIRQLLDEALSARRHQPLFPCPAEARVFWVRTGCRPIFRPHSL